MCVYVGMRERERERGRQLGKKERETERRAGEGVVKGMGLRVVRVWHD